MATRIKLPAFIDVCGGNKQMVANMSGRHLKTVYNWLADDSAEYLVDYDARSNRVLKVERHEIKRVDGFGDETNS